jgi:hypothetical protein
VTDSQNLAVDLKTTFENLPDVSVALEYILTNVIKKPTSPSANSNFQRVLYVLYTKIDSLSADYKLKVERAYQMFLSVEICLTSESTYLPFLLVNNPPAESIGIIGTSHSTNITSFGLGGAQRR